MNKQKDVCAVGPWKCLFFFFFKVSHSGHEVVGEWQCEAWGGESVRCQVGAWAVIKMIQRGGRSWRTFIKDEAPWLLPGRVAVSSGPKFWGSRHFTQWLISESSAFRVTDSYTLTRQVPLVKHHSHRFDFLSQRDHCRKSALYIGVHFALQIYITEHEMFSEESDTFSPLLTASCREWGACWTF